MLFLVSVFLDCGFHISCGLNSLFYEVITRGNCITEGKKRIPIDLRLARLAY